MVATTYNAAARTVPCPTCGAEPGIECASPKTGKKAHGPHKTRIRLADQIDTATESVQLVEEETNIDFSATVEANTVEETVKPVTKKRAEKPVRMQEELDKLDIPAKTYLLACAKCLSMPGELCRTETGANMPNTHKERSSVLMDIYRAGLEDGFNLDSYLDGYMDGKALRESKLS